jgi:WhiB family redox-sensing transcriptional regulator
MSVAFLAALFDQAQWRRQAACRDLDAEMFFPSKGQPTLPAKTVCASCPVREPCLDYAMTIGERFGIWGGTSERERKQLRRRHRRSGSQWQQSRPEAPRSRPSDLEVRIPPWGHTEASEAV